jgi:hypothetical protein
LDTLRELRDEHRNHGKRKELKFKDMEKIEVKNLLHDIVAHDSTISIHVEKGTTEKPLNLLCDILNNMSKKRMVPRISIAGSEFGGNSYLGGIGSPRAPQHAVVPTKGYVQYPILTGTTSIRYWYLPSSGHFQEICIKGW